MTFNQTPFALSEVEGARRSEGEAFSLRSKKGFDFAQPERILVREVTAHV